MDRTVLVGVQVQVIGLSGCIKYETKSVLFQFIRLYVTFCGYIVQAI
jgi:hypothetical protein